MAEHSFQEVMRQYKRMCRGKECSDCDFYKFKMSLNHQMACLRFLKEYPVEAEALVMNWAAEHPVVYPTWEEWLVANGIMEPDDVRLNGGYRFYYNGKPVYNIPSPKMFDHIPADIAEKLGIEPKEGV